MTVTERLRDLLAVEAAATPGPWEAYTWPGDNDEPYYHGIEIGDREVKLAPDSQAFRDSLAIMEARNNLQPLAQAILDVLEVHRPITVPKYDGFGTVAYQTCEICRHDNYPCPTVRLITKHLGVQACDSCTDDCTICSNPNQRDNWCEDCQYNEATSQ